MAGYVVSDIMTRNPITLSEEDNLENIAQGMEEFHLRHLPVVDGHKLVGLVSHRDILRMAVSALDRAGLASVREHSIEESTFVAQVMTREVSTVRPNTPIEQAARILVDHKFGCVPVVDDGGNLVGIVTEHDLLELLVSMLETDAQGESSARRSIPRFDRTRDDDADITPTRE